MIITLLTDFGYSDPYVGILKGVISGIAPEALVIDLTHDIPPQDIAAGAYAIDSAYSYFPDGTVHLLVVDPGVGSERRPVAMEIAGHYFVGPDNGLTSFLLEKNEVTRAVTLSKEQYHRGPVSRTFHARDIFAPVAAHLANGIQLEAFGPALRDPVRLSLPRPLPTSPLTKLDTSGRGDIIVCHVLVVDRFGNLITDLKESHLADRSGIAEIWAGGRRVPGPVESYAAVGVGELLAIFGSTGRLEIAVRNGSASRVLGLAAGDEIIVTLASIVGGDLASPHGRKPVMIKECPTCGCTIPPFAEQCPRCAGLKSAPQVASHIDTAVLADKRPEVAPESPNAEDAKKAAERERHFKDASAARETYLAFSGAGLPVIRSRELPTSVVLARGENCYLCTRAGHWTENADGTRKAGDYGQLLITDHRVLFKSFKGPIHEHEVGGLQQVSYDLDSISVKRDESRPRDIYKLEQPADAMVKLLCVYKMANLTPPMDGDKLKALMEPTAEG